MSYMLTEKVRDKHMKNILVSENKYLTNISLTTNRLANVQFP